MLRSLHPFTGGNEFNLLGPAVKLSTARPNRLSPSLRSVFRRTGTIRGLIRNRFEFTLPGRSASNIRSVVISALWARIGSVRIISTWRQHGRFLCISPAYFKTDRHDRKRSAVSPWRRWRGSREALASEMETNAFVAPRPEWQQASVSPA